MTDDKSPSVCDTIGCRGIDGWCRPPTEDTPDPVYLCNEHMILLRDTNAARASQFIALGNAAASEKQA